MKNIIAFAFFSITFSFSAHGALSGKYTIDSSSSASSTNYTNFSSAISDMVSGSRNDGGTANGKGVSGPVVFEVADGSYNEQLNITSIKGVSSKNTIIFKSASKDSSKVLLYYPSSSSTTNNFVINMSGVQWMTFKQMTIQRTGSSYYSTVIVYSGGSHNNSFINNRLISIKTTNYLYDEETVISSPADNDTNNLIENNFIQYGSIGIHLVGNTGSGDLSTIISNNRIDSSYFAGLYLSYLGHPQVIGNTLNIAYSQSTNGMYLKSTVSAKVLKNRVYLAQGHYGIYFNNSTGSTKDHQVAANNFIVTGSNSTTTISYGIYASSASYLDIYYNNCLLTGSNSSLAPVYLESSSSINLLNNNFTNNGRGLGIILSSTTLTKSDYNNFYSGGSYIISYNGSSYSKVSSYYTAKGFDKNSVNINPQYYSGKDLHIKNRKLQGIGTSISSIQDDIDGQLRLKPQPAIGADELYIIDAAIMPDTSNLSVCPGKHYFISKISNVGTVALTSVAINLEVDGKLQSPYSWAGSLATGTASLSFTVDSLNLLPGKHTIKIWTSSPNSVLDTNPLNDTARYVIKVVTPSLNAHWKATLTSKGAYSFLAVDTLRNISSYNWDFGDSTGTISGFRVSHKYSADNTYMVSLSIKDSLGCISKFDSSIKIFTDLISFKREDFNISVSPNPFIDQTTVSFTLKKNTRLKLSIFSLEGNLVQTIYDREFEAGKYYPIINARDFGLGQGVYILKITGNDFSVSKRIILVR